MGRLPSSRSRARYAGCMKPMALDRRGAKLAQPRNIRMKTHDSAARPENGLAALATNALKGGLLLLLLVHIGLLLYYVSVGYAVDFHSDSAVKNLLAQEMMETGSYFPPGWNYVNGDLWVVYGQLFIAPLLPWFANDFNLHAVSSVVASILVLLSTWLASGMVMQSKWTRLTIIAVLTSGVSFILAENLFGQGSYGSVLYTSFFLIYFAWRWMLGVTRAGSIGWGLAFCLFNTLTFWSNPQRALAYDALPLAAGLLAWVMGTRNIVLFESRGGNARGPTQQVRRALALSAMLVLSGLLGIMLHSWTLSFVNQRSGRRRSPLALVRRLGIQPLGHCSRHARHLRRNTTIRPAGHDPQWRLLCGPTRCHLRAALSGPQRPSRVEVGRSWDQVLRGVYLSQPVLVRLSADDDQRARHDRSRYQFQIPHSSASDGDDPGDCSASRTRASHGCNAGSPPR